MPENPAVLLIVDGSIAPAAAALAGGGPVDPCDVPGCTAPAARAVRFRLAGQCRWHAHLLCRRCARIVRAWIRESGGALEQDSATVRPRVAVSAA